MINPRAIRGIGNMIRDAREFEETLRDIAILSNAPYDVARDEATITCRADIRGFRDVLADTERIVRRTRRRLICHCDPMLRRFRRCEATAAPEVIEDE